VNVKTVRKVVIATRVPLTLADAVADLAERGDRSVSREVARALREHVARSDRPESTPATVGKRDG
jgi:hypothetical protein